MEVALRTKQRVLNPDTAAINQILKIVFKEVESKADLKTRFT